jgi:hypothetical protein
MVGEEMTRQILELSYRTRWISIGIILFLCAISLLPIYYDPVRFWVKPVAKMQGELVARTNDGVLIRMYGEKLRGAECRFLDIQAFGDRMTGLPIDLYISRVDMPSLNQTKPKGSYDIGIWNIHPTAQVTHVRVYVSHDCEGTKWGTQIAKVKL